MLVSLGAKPFCAPLPVMLVGTYDALGRANLVTVIYGGICSLQPPSFCISLSRSSWSRKAIEERGAFTVCLPSRAMVAQADFAGFVSGRQEDKFSVLGLTPVPGQHVDAPYVGECPVVLELALTYSHELGSHILYVGEIMDLKVEKAALREEGVPDPARIDTLGYAPLAGEYLAVGEFVARANAVGKTVRNAWPGGKKA